MFRVLRIALPFAAISALCWAQSPIPPADANASASAQPAVSAAKAVVASAGPSSKAAAAPVAPVDNPLGEARIFYRQGNFPGAIAKYEQFVQQHPQSPDGYAGLVRVYLKQKDVEHAVQMADKGIAQSDSPRMRSARAEVWFRQGKIHEAEKEWVEIVNSGYPEARAFLGLARIRDAIAMYKTAKALIDKAHALDPDDSDIQQEWIGTLSLARRIKYLEESLAGENNWDAEEREGVKNDLEYLQERVQQKKDSCRLVSKVTATETPLTRLLIDPTHLNGYGLSVALNGHKSKLLLDTGASGILVTRSIAQHAGISKISQTKLGGIGDKGRRNGYVGVADSIKIGDLEFQNCSVEVIEQRSVVEDEGLIGADVFEDFLVEIDFPNEKLKLSQLPKRPGESEQKLALNREDDDTDDSDASEPKAEAKSGESKTADAKIPAPASGPQDRYIAPEMQSYTRVFRFGHDLLVPTSIGNVPSKLFVMDTGATTNFISPAAAREVTKVHNDSDTIVKGISGRVNDVFTANKAVLSFGHLRQENQDMTAFDTKNMSDSIGTEISGFLGFTTLRVLDIKIDYRDALVDFQYDAKRFGR
jgi:predicted aspartyl protease/Tfp pilus assembly protein PilF